MKKTMKKTLAIVLAIFMIVSTVPVVFATTEVANGTAGEGITWVLDSDGTLTVSGTGEIVVEDDTPPWNEYNESITSVVVEEGITNLPRMFVRYATNLKTASIPSTVSDFHYYAFRGCTSLEEINIHDDNESYKSIDGVAFTEDEKTLVAYPANKSGAEYTIPASVTTIGEYAFSFNISLESLTIPDTVTTLGFYSFECSEIDTIIVGNGITEIPTGCFARTSVKTVVISDSVKAINYAAFWAATELETLIIGSGVETVADDILAYTSQLSVVHYKGTQETWDAISINEENADLNSKTLHFISADSYKAQVAATCADGHTAGYYCDECNAYLTGEVIPAVDEHTPGAEVEENVVAPDCTTAGSKDVVTYCTVCGEEASRETVETAVALGHDWNNSVCGTCGETCAHDDDYDEICDECGAEVPITEAKLDETNTVYIPEEDADVVVKFTPTETGDYVIYSDNGGDDGNIDPYVDIYDSNGDEVEDDDDHNGSYNFYCIFEAEAGETYYIELSCYDGDVEYDYTIEKYVDISHQPTAGEPYVELTWDVDADYQWYSADTEDAEVTDENAKGRYADGEECATYNAEDGWTGVAYSNMADVNFFEVELESGQQISMSINEDVDEFGIWSDNSNDEYWYDLEANETVYFTASADDTYYVYAYCTTDARVRAYTTSYKYTAIDGEIEATLQNLEIGTKYACKVTLENGDVLTSDIFENAYAITHQPTAEEPYVELNDDTDATYQWYSVEVGETEITDENAEAYSYNDETAVYDSENGWTPIIDADNYYSSATLELEEGDTVVVEFAEGGFGYCGFWDWNVSHEGDVCGETDGVLTYEFTMDADGVYTLYTDYPVAHKIYIGCVSYTAIDGATDAVYAATEDGIYACEVTFADDTTEMSDMFEGPHIHTDGETVEENYVAPTCTEAGSKDVVVYCSVCDAELSRETETIDATGHNDADNDGYCDGCDECVDPSVECDHNCHKGGIVGFFWKIANFFNRIFGTKQYCDCSIAHY